MPINTPNLGLFDYNPITDGNLAFNITQALSNNFNVIDTAFGNLMGNFSGYLSGFTISNDSVSPNSIIDISSGICMDSTNSNFIKVVSGIKKSLSGNWVAGSGNTGLDTGSVAPNSEYNVFTIINPITEIIDNLLSLSLSPVLPFGFTLFRRIGSIFTNSSGNIIPFYQSGNYFYWKIPVMDIIAVMSTSARTLYKLSVPGAVPVIPIINIMTDASTGTNIITSPLQNDVAPTSSLFDTYGGSVGAFGYCSKHILTNTGQIGARAMNGSAQIFILTSGYIDFRGKG